MNKLRGASVITWIVPGRENFFAVDYFPRRVTLTDTLFLRILFALRLGFSTTIFTGRGLYELEIGPSSY